MNNKKAQQTMSMPFGMIFAIFLIVVFIAFAFMAIGGFIKWDNTANVGMFYEELQEEVNDAKQSQSKENATFKINLPKEIKRVCFANLSKRITSGGSEYEEIKFYDIYNANVFLVPPEHASNMEYKLIEGVDLEKITAEKNPYCVSTDDDLIINKGFYDRLVTIQ